MNKKKWKIWFKTFNDAGEQTGSGVCINSYTRKGNAVRAAKKQFDGLKGFECVVTDEQISAFRELGDTAKKLGYFT